MKRKIKLTESQLRHIVRKYLNEADWATSLDRAYAVSDENLKWELYKDHGFSWHNLSISTDDIISNLNNYINFGRQNGQVKKWMQILEKFKDFCDRKYGQVDRIENIANNTFASEHNGLNPTQYEMQLNDRFKKWQQENPDGYEDEFVKTLSPDEQIFWDEYCF